MGSPVVQIFGTNKCFDTKKALRFFKERGVTVQFCDLKERPMSRGEFDSVLRALCELPYDETKKGAEMIRYLAYEVDRADKLYENQGWLRTPIVRFGKEAAVGYAPEAWKSFCK